MANRISHMLRIRNPIIQAPMLGVATPEMVAAANRADCLGSLPLGDADYQICIDKIRETKRVTDKPFAVNIFVNEITPITKSLKFSYNRTKAYLQSLSEELSFDIEFPEIEDIQPKGYRQQIPAILEEGIRFLSFTFGNLDRESIQLLHDNDVLLIGTCNSLQEAQMLEKSDIDIICVQGIEAGGHRGTFKTEDIPKISGRSLLQRVSESVATPLIYAGGITSKGSIEAAHALGAEGFQVGSLLLCSKESALAEFQKDRIHSAKASEIVLSKSFSGRYARGIRNKFINLFESSDYVLPYPYQNKLTKAFRTAAKESGDVEWLSIWVGQSFQNLSSASTELILRDLAK